MLSTGLDWQRYDVQRLARTPGPVLDVGCLGWDWSRQFFGQRLVIGMDPLESEQPEADRGSRTGVRRSQGLLPEADQGSRTGVRRSQELPEADQGEEGAGQEWPGTVTEEPRHVELIRAVAGLADGTVRFRQDEAVLRSGLDTSWETGSWITVPAVCLATVIQARRPAIVKLNVEGAEYPLLWALRHPVADQVAVSFHDVGWCRQAWQPEAATAAVLGYLKQYYEVIEICPRWGWRLLLAK